MNKKSIFWVCLVLFLLLSPAVYATGNDEKTKLKIIPKNDSIKANETTLVNHSAEQSTGQTGFERIFGHDINITDPDSYSGKHEDKEYSSNFTDTDAYSDIAVSAWDKIMLHMAEDINGQYGGMVEFIFQFITWNIKPWEIVSIAELEHQMWLLIFPLSAIIVLAVLIARSAALAEPQGYKTLFGNVDIIQNDFVGGGLFVIIALASEGTVMAILFALDLINAYLMSGIFESIRPSPNNAVMYLCMAIIWLLLFIFFFYRQVMIVAMYVVAPIFGMFFATGMFKEMIDSIGDKFLKALIMQPICIFITNVAIKVMEASYLHFYGISMWEASTEVMFYLALFAVLLLTCIWCLFTKVNFFRRAVSFAVYRKVL